MLYGKSWSTQPCSPFLSQAEPSPWSLQVPEEFGKEPVLCEQARNCFIWTYSYSWDWPKGAGKVGCWNCLPGCCDSKAAVYCLLKIMMNGKSKQCSRVQEWQKIGSGMLSGAGFYLSPCKIVVHHPLLEPISKLKQDREIIRNRHPDCFL